MTTATLTDTAQGFELASSTPVSGTILVVQLADGVVCLNADQGATVAIDEQRLNFTCGGNEEGHTMGLVGGLTQDAPGLWSARRVALVPGQDGFTAATDETVAVMRLILASGEEFVASTADHHAEPRADIGAAPRRQSLHRLHLAIRGS